MAGQELLAAITALTALMQGAQQASQRRRSDNMTQLAMLSRMPGFQLQPAAPENAQPANALAQAFGQDYKPSGGQPVFSLGGAPYTVGKAPQLAESPFFKALLGNGGGVAPAAPAPPAPDIGSNMMASLSSPATMTDTAPAQEAAPQEETLASVYRNDPIIQYYGTQPATPEAEAGLAKRIAEIGSERQQSRNAELKQQRADQRQATKDLQQAKANGRKAIRGANLPVDQQKQLLVALTDATDMAGVDEVLSQVTQQPEEGRDTETTLALKAERGDTVAAAALDRLARQRERTARSTGADAAAIARQTQRELIKHQMEREEAPLAEATATKVAQLDSVIQMGNEALQLYRPEYTGPAQGRMGAFREKVTGKISDEEIQFRRILADMSDLLMRERSGAAIGERKEIDRLLGIVPTPNLPDNVFKARTVDFLESVQQFRDNRLKLATTARGKLAEQAPRVAVPKPGGLDPTTLTPADLDKMTPEQLQQLEKALQGGK